MELSHPTAGDPTIDAYYAYASGGMLTTPLTELGTYGGLFANLNYTQAGFTQVAPVPEPSSLTLLVSSIPGILGLVWFRRRKAADGRGGAATCGGSVCSGNTRGRRSSSPPCIRRQG